MKIFYMFTISLMILAISLGCGNENPSSSYSENVDVNFTVLQSSQYSSYTDHHSKILKVIQTQSDYESELAKYSNEEAVSVDFSAYNVVLADLGERGDNSYFLEIPSVYEDAKGNLHVVVVSKEPQGENCGGSAIMTDPYAFAKIPAGKDVYFDERVEYYNCP